MQEFVARENIERFRRLIVEEPDGPNRDRLERMLVAEQAKLQAYQTGLPPTPSATQDDGDIKSALNI